MRERSLQVVRTLAALRVGLGAAFLVAPRRLSLGDEVLMTRSFAVRELVIGIGGLSGVRSDPQRWAQLGVLVDVGDTAASSIALRRKVPMAGWALFMAAGALAAEAWAAKELAARAHAHP